VSLDHARVASRRLLHHQANVVGDFHYGSFRKWQKFHARGDGGVRSAVFKVTPCLSFHLCARCNYHACLHSTMYLTYGRQSATCVTNSKRHATIICLRHLGAFGNERGAVSANDGGWVYRCRQLLPHSRQEDSTSALPRFAAHASPWVNHERMLDAIDNRSPPREGERTSLQGERRSDDRRLHSQIDEGTGAVSV
jgi:hypothetical protein